jgi:hypothetical protein
MEGTSETHDYGPRWLFPPNFIETRRIRTFTYQSFADSRRFFTVIR